MKNSFIFFVMGFMLTNMFMGITTKRSFKAGIIGNEIPYIDSGLYTFFYDIFDDRFISFTEKTDEKIYIDGTINLSQSKCNDFYNEYWEEVTDPKKRIGGTCGPVAITSVIEYYKTKDGFRTCPSPLGTFCSIEDYALKKGLTTRKNGTADQNMDNLLTESFKMFNPNTTRSGVDKTDMVRKRVRNEILNGKICILGLTKHYVVCCGVTKYEVKYYKNSKKKDIMTKEYEFFIINDGYGSGPGSNLFYTNYIANDYLYLFNGFHLTINIKG